MVHESTNLVARSVQYLTQIHSSSMMRGWAPCHNYDDISRVKWTRFIDGSTKRKILGIARITYIITCLLTFLKRLNGLNLERYRVFATKSDFLISTSPQCGRPQIFQTMYSVKKCNFENDYIIRFQRYRNQKMFVCGKDLTLFICQNHNEVGTKYFNNLFLVSNCSQQDIKLHHMCNKNI